LIKGIPLFYCFAPAALLATARNPPWTVYMKTGLIYSLTEHFEAHAQQTNSGVEFWLARDLQHLLGYAKWENFVKVVNKAQIACETSGHAAAGHFLTPGKWATSARAASVKSMTSCSLATPAIWPRKTAIPRSTKLRLHRPISPSRPDAQSWTINAAIRDNPAPSIHAPRVQNKNT
jgi:hypothetical protein